MQPQLPLSPSPARSRKLRVTRDYGPLGIGVSAARYVLAENGEEYIAKGPTLSPNEPYVAVNELISAMVGHELGLPVLDFCVLELGDDLVFGSSWMQKNTFDPAITPDTLARCDNLDRVYDLVVFDTWLCNEDRHEQNLLVRRPPQSGGTETLFLLLNDHSRCLLPPGLTPATMATHWLGTRPERFIRLDYLKGHITNRKRLADAVDAVEQLEEDVVRTFVRLVPEEWLAVAERQPVEDFLLARRAELRRVFNESAQVFPALNGARL